MKSIYDPEAIGLNIARVGEVEIQVFCPYHHDKNPSASYNIEGGVFYCFGCQESKTARQLAEDLGGSLIPVDKRSIRPPKIGADLEWIKMRRRSTKPKSSYLKDRLVTQFQIDRYDITENSQGVIFPISDFYGTVRGMQIRHFERLPKYQLFGERLPIWPYPAALFGSRLFVTEGVFGALRGELYGRFTGALMGAGNVLSAIDFFRTNGGIGPVGVFDSDYAGLVAAGKFTLAGFPVVLAPRNWPEGPDDWDSNQWNICHEYISYDVNEIIARSDRPQQLEQTLKKFWRKHNWS